jgi:dihydroorotate dehydrogenase
MHSLLFNLARPVLMLANAERAHELTLRALEVGVYPRCSHDDPRLAQTLWGLHFPNPLGMAAGFDKGGRAASALLALGFGFTEAGTVTPKPQPGNPRPRVFRLPAEGAVINRMGFNSEGHAVVHTRLAARRPAPDAASISQKACETKALPPGILAINIGANKTSADPVDDYILGLRAFSDLASLITLNISSPNTPGLRDLQAAERLDGLLCRVMAEREALAAAGMHKPPLLVKLAPDIADTDLPAIVDCVVVHNVDGIVLTNTTIARDGVAGARNASESGGLSGRPLFRRATRMLAKVYLLTEGRMPLIGVGGVDSGEAALAKILAGASLVQLYTALIYEGPALLGRIKRHLADTLTVERLDSLAALRGRDAARFAATEL